MRGYPPPKKRWSKQAMDQLKAKTKKDFIKQLDKDPAWNVVPKKDAPYVFHNPDKPKGEQYVAIHYHPKQRFNCVKLLKTMLEQICWTESQLKKAKFIK
mgnify:CR=1 FL=1